MLNLLICNNRLEDVENINKNIALFKSIFNESNIFIFHDSDIQCDSYDKSAIVFSINKNIGLLAGRKYLVEHIPEKYNNEYFIWLDSDDLLLPQELQRSYDEIYKNNWDYYGLLNTDRVWNKIYRLSLLKEAYEVIPQDMFGFKILYQEDSFIKSIIFDIAVKRQFNNIKSADIRFIKYNGYHAPNLSNPESAKKFFESFFIKEIWGINKVGPFKILPRQLSIIIYNDMKHYGENYILGIINDIISKLPEKYHSYFKDIIDSAQKLDLTLNTK